MRRSSKKNKRHNCKVRYYFQLHTRTHTRAHVRPLKGQPPVTEGEKVKKMVGRNEMYPSS